MKHPLNTCIWLFFFSLLMVFSACKKESPNPPPGNSNNNNQENELPEVTTANITSITDTTAISGGVVVDSGSSEVIVRGICYGTEPEPTTTNFVTQNGTGLGNFTSELTGLEPDTEYFVRAYATNSVGTGYGEEFSFTTTGTIGSTIIVNEDISSYTVWSNDFVWQLGGRISVENGATLEIEAGTVIKGEAGTGANATCLLVARGGTILAEGNANAPIIFTSVADEIEPADVAGGNYASPNLSPDLVGLWGGVIVLGNAPISASNDNGDLSEVQIGGIPISDQNGLYGGNNPGDNSGILKNVSIRHGGTSIGAGNEITGLTLGGVGSETIVENIEVVANQYDGVRCFGGTVDASNVVVWNCHDDGFDTDQAWAGTCDNFVIVGVNGHCLELDGPEGSYQAGHTFSNGSIKASYQGNMSVDLINVDNNSIVNLTNIYFTDINNQQINNVTAPGVNFSGIQLDVAPNNLEDYVNGPVPPGIIAGGSPQANISVFGWTWASQAGVLSGL